jgi:hypothetical protein
MRFVFVLFLLLLPLCSRADEPCSRKFGGLPPVSVDSVADLHLDDLVDAVQVIDKLFSSDTLPVNMGEFGLKDAIQNKGKAAVEAELRNALGKSQQAPQVFYGMAVYRGKMYTQDYFRQRVYGNVGMDIKDARPAHLIGQEMPYLESKGGHWGANTGGGSASILGEMLAPGKPVTLFRGMSSYEADAWTFLNWLEKARGAPVVAGDIKLLDTTIAQAKAGGFPFPDAFVRAWDQEIKPGIQGKTNGDLVDAILSHWSNDHMTVFTTPNESAADAFTYWQKQKNHAAIMQFDLDPAKVSQTERNGIYAGIENEYVEMGFSTPEALRALLHSFKGKAPPIPDP